jgi:hypothetical protein
VAKRSRKKKPQREDDPFDELATKRVFDRVLLFGQRTAGGDDDVEVPHHVDAWLDALEDFDSGDKSTLVNLMKSGNPLPDELLPHIGDLLDRWAFKRPPHKMRLPSYRMTRDELEMSNACAGVMDLLAAGLDLDAALTDVAAKHDVTVAKLREYYGKRRGPDRRAKARKYDAKRRQHRS